MIVKKGDTLESIAAEVYGDSKKWRRIAKANNIRNPRKIKPGVELAIPSLEE